MLTCLLWAYSKFHDLLTWLFIHRLIAYKEYIGLGNSVITKIDKLYKYTRHT